MKKIPPSPSRYQETILIHSPGKLSVGLVYRWHRSQYSSYQFSSSLAGPLHYGCPTFIVLSLHLSAFPDSTLQSTWLQSQYQSVHDHAHISSRLLIMGLKSDHHGLSIRFLKGKNPRGTASCLHLLETPEDGFPTTYHLQLQKKNVDVMSAGRYPV